MNAIALELDGASNGAPSVAAPPAAVQFELDPDFAPAHALPRDHPPWARDTLSLSLRARALLAQIRPQIVRVLTFWDHRVRSAIVGGVTVAVDPSGCYRV